jgi:glycosyltransferase involved in cell wall biosynthesis
MLDGIQPMKIIFLAGRERSYMRNQVLIDAFSHLGAVSVTAQNYRGRSILTRSLLSIMDYRRLATSNSFDLIVVGFYGNLIARLIGKKVHTPLLFDAFVSTYDTLVNDRRIFSPNSPGAKASTWLDAQACQRADHLLCDTRANAGYFMRQHAIPADKIDRIFVGCDEFLFKPATRVSKHDTIEVLFYGTYLPLHGVDVIVRAAALLQDQPQIHVSILGDGKGRPEIQKIAEAQHLANVRFLPAVPIKDLPAVIGQADICLGGPFGPGQKADRVITGKTFQMLAMAKPVIVSANSANPELLTDRRDALFCKRMDPRELADAILHLAESPSMRTRIGENGYRSFKSKASLPIIEAQLKQILMRMGV